MGGHGGLNILPQKRWNVYGRENRLKVAQDEAKYAEELRVQKEKHQAAERQFRHKLLLDRARERSGAAENSPSNLASSSSPPEAPEQPASDSILQHINFFKEEEAKAKNDEAEEDRRKESRKRGNPDTQTSDAKFDERFEFAHGLYGKEHQPWYAKKRKTMPEDLIDSSADPVVAAASPAEHSGASDDSRLHRKKHKSKKKHKKDHKKLKNKDRADGRPAAGKKSIEELRAERMARETAERDRQRRVILKTLQSEAGGSGQGPLSKKYHSGFGHAAAPLPK